MTSIFKLQELQAIGRTVAAATYHRMVSDILSVVQEQFANHLKSHLDDRGFSDMGWGGGSSANHGDAQGQDLEQGV